MRYCRSHMIRQPQFYAKVCCALFIAGMINAFATGCGKGSNNGCISVSGCVRLDGRPLSGASVTFYSDTAQIPGLTDSNGRYELKSGVTPGEYRVVISKMEGSEQAMLAVDPGAIGRVKPSAGSASLPKQIVPARYSNPTKTELRFSVASTGTTRADFDLGTRKLDEK